MPSNPTTANPSLSLGAKLAWIFGLIGIDQWSKFLAVRHIAGEPPRVFFGDLFRMEFAINSGAFLSLGAKLSAETRFWVFVVAVGAFLAGAAWVLFRDRTLDRASAFSLAIILGGGIGNLIDRIFRPNHGVIDFLNVGIGELRTGIFNIADMAIMLGVILLAIKSFQSRGEEKSRAEANPT